MNKKKVVAAIVSIFITISIGCIAISQFYINKPNIIKSEMYSCEVENCPEMNGKSLNGSVDIYSGINSEEQCKSVDGYPIIVYFGITGQRTYMACGVK